MFDLKYRVPARIENNTCSHYCTSGASSPYLCRERGGFFSHRMQRKPLEWQRVYYMKELHTSRSQHGIHAYSIRLVTASRARYKVDWGLGVDVVMSRYCVVEDWPEAFVRVLMRFNDNIHTVLEKQRFEAGENTNRKAMNYFPKFSFASAVLYDYWTVQELVQHVYKVQ